MPTQEFKIFLLKFFLIYLFIVLPYLGKTTRNKSENKESLLHTSQATLMYQSTSTNTL
jgi:hypothetical protein